MRQLKIKTATDKLIPFKRSIMEHELLNGSNMICCGDATIAYDDTYNEIDVFNDHEHYNYDVDAMDAAIQHFKELCS
jgi:hypothetical protein